MVRHQCIYHGQHSDTSEEECRDEGDSITEVQHADGEGAENDGEVEP